MRQQAVNEIIRDSKTTKLLQLIDILEKKTSYVLQFPPEDIKAISELDESGAATFHQLHFHFIMRVALAEQDRRSKILRYEEQKNELQQHLKGQLSPDDLGQLIDLWSKVEEIDATLTADLLDLMLLKE